VGAVLSQAAQGKANVSGSKLNQAFQQ